MKLPAPLIPGVLLRRYKRFLADVELADGEQVTAHCANPGSMLGINTPGLKVWLSESADPNRKLKYSWELVQADGTLVGAYPNRANALAEEAVVSGVIAPLAGYERLRREVKYGANSRIDLLLETQGRPPCYVEVKNVHMRRDGDVAEFPDSVTARGTRHLGELSAMVRQGARAVQLYIVQRADCSRFRPAADIDPAYAAALNAAIDAGVEAMAYACAVTTDEIRVTRPLEMEYAA
ncbi:MAG: DNA/RNA nuclease SfsA [Maricaulaceae bacterium]|nr:DNA/RNA nuclease SfsA [Maricaulaceae bacterium]